LCLLRWFKTYKISGLSFLDQGENNKRWKTRWYQKGNGHRNLGCVEYSTGYRYEEPTGKGKSGVGAEDGKIRPIGALVGEGREVGHGY
jgi:hypothetical protein